MVWNRLKASENGEQKNPWSLATSGVEFRAVANRPLHPEAYCGRGITISTVKSKLENNGVQSEHEEDDEEILEDSYQQ